jgi:DNA-binding NarL/FixJ family response regulator
MGASKAWNGRKSQKRKVRPGYPAARVARGRNPIPRAVKNRRSAATPARIRILVADDQPIDRKGMAALLQSVADFEVIAESAQAEDASRRCQELSPSIVILALRLPAPEGRTALSVIRSSSPETPVLALAERGEGHCMVLNPPRSGHVPPRENGIDCAYGTDCLQLAVVEGATGTIRRSADPEELFRAIRTVASGKAWYESGTAASIMRHALAGHDKEGQPALSQREMEVAGLIADGRSNKEIAQALKISEPTVKKHVGHILMKLKLQDRLQIGLYIARNPLVLRRQGSLALGR